LAEPLRTVYLYTEWSLDNLKSGAGQEKSAGQRPTSYNHAVSYIAKSPFIGS